MTAEFKKRMEEQMKVVEEKQKKVAAENLEFQEWKILESQKVEIQVTNAKIEQ